MMTSYLFVAFLCVIASQWWHQRKPSQSVISLLGDLVIADKTNFLGIVPKAYRTFHDQCPVHIRVLAMFTAIFRVKGGGRFRATTFCFLNVVFSVVVAPLGVFIFTAIRISYLLPLFICIRWTLYIALVLESIFVVSVAFFFFIKWLSKFLFLIKPLSIPNSVSPSWNVFSARSLVTSLLCGSITYSSSSAMFVTGIIRLFRGNCPLASLALI